MKSKHKRSGALTALSLRALAIPLFVLIAGTIATLAIGYQYDRLARERDSDRFNAIVDERVKAISSRIDSYISLLRGAAALMFTEAQAGVGPDAFRRYVSRLSVADFYPGLQGLGFARAVPSRMREPFEELMRAELFPEFTIWPEGERDFYSAVVFLEPSDARNREAIGFDMFSDPTRRDAMSRARDSGARATSGKVELVQEIDSDRQPGFLIYLPVFQGGAIPDTVEQRREMLLGWVYSPFRARDFFDRSFELRNRTPELKFAVFDGGSVNDDSLLYQSAADASLYRLSDYHTLESVVVGDRLWTVSIATTPDFERDSARALYPYILGFGILASLLLALATFGQALAAQRASDANAALETANETLENQVEKRTAQLERARASLAGLIANLERAVDSRTADLTAANEEIQRFAYIVSHDLRAPLINVMGFTSELETVRSDVEQFMREVTETAPELVTDAARAAIETDLPEALSFIRASTVKMDRLINAILRLSREGRRVLMPELIDMGDLVRGIEANLTHQLDEEGAEIVVENMPDIVSDRLAIEQVFGNVIENAVKYLQPGLPGRVVVRGFEEAGHFRYEIEDNGRGIDPKDHERVFDLFRRAGQQDRPGEGIGLAHVRALVRRLGGTITVTSQLGRGSAFQISLPKVLESGSQEAA